MPFFGLPLPANRVQGLYGGALPVATISSAPLSQIVDATAQTTPGIPAWYKDANGKISVLCYAQAQASVPFGAALIHQAGLATTLNSAGVSTQNGLDQGFVAQASTGSAYSMMAYNFAGVAAASVINTGYYFWRYIHGYVPYAKVGSAIPSMSPLVVAPSTAGVLGKVNAAFNASGHAGTSATMPVAVGYTFNLTDNLDGSMASIWLNGWYA